VILRGWEIEGFGVFRGTALSDVPEGLTLVVGPNEAGKSTLLGFLRFMLFGFPRGEQQKYPPLQGGRHGGRLTFEDAEGLWTLERFQGQPARLWAPDGRQLGEEGLRSRLGGLDADMFRSVFAFSLYELTDLAPLDREEVRDRLYSAGITGAGRSAAGVLAQLRKGLEAYLRPRSKEGQINKLSDALVAARRELAAAMALAGRFGQIEAQLADAEAKVLDQGEEARRLEQRRSHLERLEGLYVPWNRLQRLEQELAREGEPLRLDQALVQRIEGARDHLEECVKAAAAGLDACRDLEERIAQEGRLIDRRILEVADPLQAALHELALQRDRLARSERLGRDIAERRGQIAQLAGELGVPPTADLPPVEQAQVRAAEELVERLRDLGQTRARREDEEEAARGSHAQAESETQAAAEQAGQYEGVPDAEAYHARDALLTRHKEAIENLARRRGQLLAPNLIAIAFVAVGLIAIAYGQWPFAALAPIGLIAFAVLLFGRPGRDLRRLAAEVRDSQEAMGLGQPLHLSAAVKELSDLHAQYGRVTAAGAARERLRAAEEQRQAAGRLLAECGRRREQAITAEQEGRSALAAFKASVGVPLDVPPQHLPSHLRTAQALGAAQRDLATLEAQRADVERAIEGWQRQAAEILPRLGQAVPDAREAVPEVIAALEVPLQAARRGETALRLLEEQHRVALEQRERLAHAQAAAADALAESLGEAGLEDVRAFERWRDASGSYEQKLHERDIAVAAFHDQVGASADAFVEELAEGSPELWQTERSRIAERLEDLAQQRDLALRQSQDLLRLRSEIAESSDVPALSARCLELEEELRRAAEAWRAQALAGRLLERTLETYVRSRQPEVLRIASQALLGITAERYVEVRQRSDGQGLLAVETSGAVKEPHELSRGTQEQMYLALRLGLAASYGERVAALPLVLDDIAVNFDPARQARLFEVLGRFAAEPGRQALFFTCHPSLAQLAATAVPRLRVIELSAQESRAEVAAATDRPVSERIVGLLRPGPLTLKEIAKSLGSQENETRAALQALLGEGRVTALGSGRGRRYGVA
jgi:uncharacterized protein YhaN